MLEFYLKSLYGKGVEFVGRLKKEWLSTSGPVLYVPGEVFVVANVPSALHIKDQLSLAKLELEQLAPFSLEQLNWGFFTFPGEEHMLLYAAVKDRLKSLGSNKLEKSYYVFPSFLCGLTGHVFQQKTVRFLWCDQTLSCLLFEANQKLPSQIHSLCLGSEPNREVVWSQVGSLSTKYQKQGYVIEDGVVIHKKTMTASAGAVSAFLQKIRFVDDSHPTELALSWQPPALCLMADIRDEAFKQVQLKSRRIHYYLNYFVGFLVIFMVLCILFEIVYGISYLMLWLKQNTIKDQTVKVEKVIENQNLMEHIEHVYGHDLDPFDRLQELNRLRPKDLYFTQFNLETLFKAEVKGFGASIDQVNEYAELLKEQPEFTQIQLNDVQTRQGKVQFVLQVYFNTSPKKFEPAVINEGESETIEADSPPNLEPADEMQISVQPPAPAV